ncbi:LIM-domain binding protein-domain-containing protein [Schizophyllum commune]
MRGVQQKEDGRRSPPRLRRVVNEGAGLLRAMQFSGMLAVISEPKKKNPLWWRKLIDEYFLTTAVFKLTLLDYDSESTRIFRIPFHVMPRFFFTAAMAGNTCSYFTMPGLRERVMTQVTANTPGHLIVECMEAHWTFRYENGWMVNLKGPMTFHIRVGWKGGREGTGLSFPILGDRR